jgi:hypothetical protein
MALEIRLMSGSGRGVSPAEYRLFLKRSGSVQL